MKRLPVYAVLLVLLAALVLAGGLASHHGGSTSSDDPATITSYVADFRVDDGGDLTATETLTVAFPQFPTRHGIFRFFDHQDANAPRLWRKPHDISVQRDGQEEPFELLSEGGGRYTDVKIGDAFRTLTGTHTYTIRYRIDDVLLPRGKDSSRFYWNLVPSGWQMAIQSAHLSVHLPAPAHDTRCSLGAAETGGCTATGSGQDLTVQTGRLEPHTPVTLSTYLPVAAPKPAHVNPWSHRWDGILGRSPAALLVIVLLGLLAAGGGLLLSRSTREKKPSFPLQYAPPDGIGPAQAAYVVNEKVDNKMYVASLMQAAEKGRASLDPSPTSWTVGPPRQGTTPQPLDPVSDAALAWAGGGREEFTFGSDDVAAGKRLKDALSAFRSGTKAWARATGVMRASGLGGGGAVVLGLLALLTVAVAFLSPASLAAIVPGLLVVFGYEIGLPGAGTKHTLAGRDLWSRVGGFHRILSTTSAEARFDFAARKDLYTAYLPYAVAFGCADAWAKKYRIETGQEPPAPVYWAGSYSGVHTGSYVNQMVDSFDHTVSSAISAYQATQHSSSGGGGGGGFGGGGGGGGGGGSW